MTNEYDEYDEVMALAAELPKEIQPDRDLLPELSARAWRQPELRIVPEGIAEAPADVDSDGRGDDGSGRTSVVRALYPYRALLAAAAVILVAATATLTAVLVRGPAALGPSEQPSPVVVQVADEAVGSASLARYEAVEASYAAVIGQLMQALDSHRESLAPEVVELIETNLAVIDEALAESLAALQGSPADPALRRAVAAAYEQKVSLLRQASELTTGL